MFKKNGFTLIELLTTITIIVIVVAIAIYNTTKLIDLSVSNAFESDAKILLKTVSNKISIDTDYTIENIDTTKIENDLSIPTDNYDIVVFTKNDQGELYVVIKGKGKWNNLIACGVYNDIKVGDGQNCTIPLDFCHITGNQCLKDIVINDTEETNQYKGDNWIQNYVWFSGQLYRMMGLNADESIKMVTHYPVTSISWGPVNDNTYETSFVRQWLNDLDPTDPYDGVFYNSINRKDWIVTIDWCIGSQSGTNPILDECRETVNDKVGLVTYSEYVNAGYTTDGSNTYISNMNSDVDTLLMTSNADNTTQIFIQFQTEPIGIAGSSYTSGVRPVINLKNTVGVLSGTGRISDPYILDGNYNGNPGDNLHSRFAGEYVQYSDLMWRIVSINEDGSIKLRTNSVLQSGSIPFNNYLREDLVTNYGSSYSNPVHPTYPDDNTKKVSDYTYSEVKQYLNTTFYDSLVNKEWIVDGIWYLGSWKTGTHYKTTIDMSGESQGFPPLTTKVGMWRLGEMLAGTVMNWTITPNDAPTGGYNFNNSVYHSSGFTRIRSNYTTYNYNRLYPMINLSPNIYITGGTGRSSDPFTIDIR